jgi:seryl-tRNA synthetase
MIREVGSKPIFNFEVQDHEQITAVTDGISMSMGAKLVGSRFTVLKGEVAQLSRALTQWMLDTHITQHGYTEINVPVLTKPETLFGTGQLPKFKEDLFITNDERELCLIPTAEVQLANIVSDEILDEGELPMAFCAHSQCFRKEAGSYGKDTKGMFRVHQFEKVELVQIVTAEKSYEALETITGHAENILKALGLAYRVVALCGGDLGFGASKTYDIEVWVPSQKQYREISSCSNTEDFQARRMKARYRTKDKKTQFVHALNASGVAVGRLLIAVLENFQQEDGSVIIPEVIRPYMQNKSVILKKD